MNLNGKKLDEWLMEMGSQTDFRDFPHNDNYPNKYKTYSNELCRWVHPEVGVGAAYIDGTMLTNHGSDHIHTLINRATQFLEKNNYCELSPFEVYILLLAIHVHDVGNIKGRQGHELNARDIIAKLSPGVVGQDTLIWDYIYDIAVAHKGMQVETLPASDYLFEKEIRPQLLAAILKFADELAENFSRSSKINLDLDNMPEESKLYHTFASVINSIVPNPITREIRIIFNVTEHNLCTLFKKKDEEDIYLLDEIYLRTLKTYSERTYCMKFMRPMINFDVIKVTLNIKLADGKKIQNGYELAERGMENIDMREVFRICPILKEHTGKIIHDKIVQKTIL